MAIAEISNVFKIGREGHERYFGQIKTDILKQITQVFYFEYEPKNYCHQVGEIDGRKGYQRRAKPSRQKAFGTYLEAHGQNFVSPPVVLNARGKWEFVPDAPNSNTGKIVIHEPANIIDGQHRAGGFIYAYEELNNIQFAEFIAFKKLDLDYEERVFNTINTTQKGVPPSLSVNIETEKWQNRVTKMLAENSTSPFVGLISLSGEMKPEMKFQAAQVAQNVLKTFSDDVFKSVELSDDERFDFFTEAWSLIKEKFPNEWAEATIPKKEMKFKLFELTGLIAWSVVFQKRLGTHFNTTTKHIDFHGLSIMIDKVVGEIDWSKNGDFEGLTGQVGGQRIATQIMDLMQR